MRRSFNLSLSLALVVLILSFNNCSQTDFSPAAVQSTVNDSEGEPPVTSSGAETTTSSPVASSSDLSKLAGIYTGNGGTQVLFPSGDYWSLSGYGIIQVRFGQVTRAESGLFSLKLIAGNNSGTVVDGKYVLSQSFNNGAYSSRSKQVPNLSSVAGAWWGNSHDGDTPNLTLSSDGQISGYSANRQCRFSGKFQPHPQGGDVFSLSLTRANCLGNGIVTAFSGLLMKNGPLVHIVAFTSDKSQRFTWEGYPD